VAGVPAAAKILGELYSSEAVRGFFPRVKYLFRNLPFALERILEES
jgi:hypothetical protein